MKIKALLASSFILAAVFSQRSQAQEPSYFRDASLAAGVSFNHIALPNGRGMGMNTGAAWFDVDNDGYLDLYVTQGYGGNALYRNNGDGTFNEVARGYGATDSLNIGAGVAIADYNNDGWADIFLANANEDVLLQNQNGERFIDVTHDVGIIDNQLGRGTSASWGDFNNDGFLDLYVSNHFNLFNQQDIRQDRLFMNNEGDSFTDVSEWLGLDALNGFGFIGTWTDYDNDSDLDLFVINDCGFSEIFHTSKLFRNDGAASDGTWRFTDVSERTGADHCQNGMGIAVGDYDRDGYQEYFYTNIGERTLLLHYDAGTFYDSAESSGVYAYHPDGRQKWTWGANFFDYDLDGWLDLYVAAGTLWIQTDTEENPQENMFFLNNGDGSFADMSAQSGVNDYRRSRSPVYADYDADGDVDLFLVNVDQEGVLFENTLNNENNYLIIDLEGVLSNRDGIGAKLRLTTPDEAVQYWETRSGSSLGGGDDRAAYFGLGSNTTASSLEITWPSGIVQVVNNLQANQRLLVKEEVINTSIEREPLLEKISVTPYPNPFHDALSLEIQTATPTKVAIEIFDILGRRLAPVVTINTTSATQTVTWEALSTIELSQLPAGMYILHATINNSTHYQTFAIKR